MQADALYYSFSHYLKQRFDQRIRKLALHGSFSCPNRDGTLGRGGCTFCNVASFVHESSQQHSIATQLVLRESELLRKADAYLAYFQAYTNTYAEVNQLRSLYDQAITQQNVVGLCIGTRPDCVPDEVLQLLLEYQQQGHEIWLELGLQSAHDKTLKRINRGHDFAAYQRTLERCSALNIKVCTHLIVGLPGEDQELALASLQQVVGLGVQGLKLHPLHVVSGSTLAKRYQAGRYQALTLEEYAQTAALLMAHTPASVVFHRIHAYARPPTLIAPLWCSDRWKMQHAILTQLAQFGGQGCYTESPWAGNNR